MPTTESGTATTASGIANVILQDLISLCKKNLRDVTLYYCGCGERTYGKLGLNLCFRHSILCLMKFSENYQSNLSTTEILKKLRKSEMDYYKSLSAKHLQNCARKRPMETILDGYVPCCWPKFPNPPFSLLCIPEVIESDLSS